MPFTKFRPLYAQPAYGRRVCNAAIAQEMLDNGKDFKILHGPYFSKRDVAELKVQGYTHIVLESKSVETMLVEQPCYILALE